MTTSPELMIEFIEGFMIETDDLSAGMKTKLRQMEKMLRNLETLVSERNSIKRWTEEMAERLAGDYTNSDIRQLAEKTAELGTANAMAQGYAMATEVFLRNDPCTRQAFVDFLDNQ